MSTRAPLIAVTTCLDRGQRLRAGRDYVYVARAYTLALSQAGALPLLVTPDADVAALLERVDGLVITGGEDLPRDLPDWNESTSRSPADGFEIAARGVREDAERIQWERAAIAAFAAANKPVLGICYGLQLLNVHFGGSLYLDVRHEGPSDVNHGGGTEVTTHELAVEPGSSLLAGLPARLLVNSCHRQAIDLLAPGFVVSAQDTDGLVEAFERPPLYGVQWHPETDPQSAVLWQTLVGLCRQAP